MGVSITQGKDRLDGEDPILGFFRESLMFDASCWMLDSCVCEVNRIF